jgi:hypothetical protein
MIDLVVLVPDRNIEYTIKGILKRTQSLRIRSVKFEVNVHPTHDPGCFNDGPDFLRFAVNQARYALIALDYEGSGQEHNMSREEMEDDLEKRLADTGWSGRSAVVVIEPELENWVWSDSPHVDTALGWTGREPPLRKWLMQHAHLKKAEVKPSRPKETLQTALRIAGKSRTSKLYATLAEQVGLDSCVDPAFLKLKAILQKWFPQ